MYLHIRPLWEDIPERPPESGNGWCLQRVYDEKSGMDYKPSLEILRYLTV